MKEGRSGITENTPKNIMFGAGTIHRGLKFDTETNTWNYKESIVGATSGGSKLSIVPEFTELDIDGMDVAVKGLTKQKTGETANMEINFAELTEEIIKASAVAALGESEDSEYVLLKSKPDVEEGDYWENIAFVGRTLKGKNVIIIMDNALCTSGFATDGKKKTASVGTYTFECHAEADFDSDFQTLPWRVYYPQ